MKKRLNVLLGLGMIFSLLAVIYSPGYSQRIRPEMGNTSGQQQSSQDTNARQDQELILPDPAGQQQSEETREVYNQALVERLRADSAAMRVQFEEKISQLKSDSEAMRERIERLRSRIDALRARLGRVSQPADTEPGEELELPGGAEDTAMETPAEEQSETETASEGSIFNPNTASLDDLKSIPDLSDRLAERIEWYRREVRPFESRDDLRRVPGIDRQTFQNIASYFHEGPY